MITLCEECFPDAGKHEVLTIRPMTPCEQCGKLDSAKSHLFRRDPRVDMRLCPVCYVEHPRAEHDAHMQQAHGYETIHAEQTKPS